jgi:hypothetical protein
MIANPMNDDASEGESFFLKKRSQLARTSIIMDTGTSHLSPSKVQDEAPSAVNLSLPNEVSPDVSALAAAPRRFRARSVMSETAAWGRTPYIDEIHAFEPPDEVAFHLSEEDANNVSNGRRWIRPGDLIATRVTKFFGSMRSMMLQHRMKATVSYVGDLLQQEVTYKTIERKESGILSTSGSEGSGQNRRRSEQESDIVEMEENSGDTCGVLDMKLSSIADVEELKFSLWGTRLYVISQRHRKRDNNMREQFIVNMEKSTFELDHLLSYEDFVVVYRQFHRYTHGGPNLYHSRIPKNGWYFVDHNIRNLLARKIDKLKRGFIAFPDLLKHLYPAHSQQEIADILPVYTERYLAFSDKTVKMLCDTLDVDKVNHFASVFRIIDKEGRGRVTREQFIMNMPIDTSSRDDVDEVRYFLGLIFDKNARMDINEKLEAVGEVYMDLECLVQALNSEKINNYSGSLVV